MRTQKWIVICKDMERETTESAGGQTAWKGGRCYPLNENPNWI